MLGLAEHPFQMVQIAKDQRKPNSYGQYHFLGFSVSS
jgi:hypothetical protein